MLCDTFDKNCVIFPTKSVTYGYVKHFNRTLKKNSM